MSGPDCEAAQFSFLSQGPSSYHCFPPRILSHISFGKLETGSEAHSCSNSWCSKTDSRSPRYGSCSYHLRWSSFFSVESYLHLVSFYFYLKDSLKHFLFTLGPLVLKTFSFFYVSKRLNFALISEKYFWLGIEF